MTILGPSLYSRHPVGTEFPNCAAHTWHVLDSGARQDHGLARPSLVQRPVAGESTTCRLSSIEMICILPTDAKSSPLRRAVNASASS